MSATSNDLLEAYNQWARGSGYESIGAKTLGARLRALGYEPASTGNARG